DSAPGWMRLYTSSGICVSANAIQQTTTHLQRSLAITAARPSASNGASKRPPAYTYVMAPSASATGMAVAGGPRPTRPPPGPARSSQGREREQEERGLHRSPDRPAPEPEAPGRGPGQAARDAPDRGARGPPIGEPAQEEDRREDASCSKAARYLAVSPRHTE